MKIIIKNKNKEKDPEIQIYLLIFHQWSYFRQQKSNYHVNFLNSPCMGEDRQDRDEKERNYTV